MARSNTLSPILLVLVALTADPARGCGSVEEGTITAVRCAVPITTDFTTFGTQVMSPSGSSRDLSVCYRNGTCVDREPNNYQAEMAVGISNSTGESLYVLIMKVGSVSREDPVVQCVIDGIVSAQCTLDVYVTPEKPVCESPGFLQNGTILLLKCSADKVYPNAAFVFLAQPEVKDQSVKQTHQPSSRYPGDKRVTAELRVPVRNHAAGDYTFRPVVQVDVPDLSPDDQVEGDSILVRLSETALGSHHTGDDVYEIEVGANLKRTIRISGKPPPNRFSLTMRPADTKDSTSLTVLDSDYALSQDGGNLRLELRDVGRSGPGFGYYTFRAGNGVGGSWPQLEYTFTVQEKDGGSDGLDISVILGMAVGAALLLGVAVGALICLVRRWQSRKASARRNGNFDPTYYREGSPYIYPNLSYQTSQDDYHQTVNPPPYTADDHPYAAASEYMEIDQTLVEHVKQREASRASMTN